MTFREFQIGSSQHRAALQLRESVLRQPLGLTLTADDLANDGHCFHLGAFDSDRLIAVLLLQPLRKHTLQMRQVAVHPEHQGRGLGARLVAFAESFARDRGYTTLVAHARTSALQFYLKGGYVASGAPFLEHTVLHQLVTKQMEPLF